MPAREKSIIHRDVTIDGSGTRRWVIDAAECPELRTHRISRLGLDECGTGYERVRVTPSGSFVMACTGGRGRILLDGAWHAVKSGTVCMAPPRVVNAFHASRGARWHFVWVRYEEPRYVQPVVNAASPVRLDEGAESLARSVAGLRDEWEHARDPKLLHHWIELIHAHCRRFAQPWRSNERLAHLWRDVEARPDHAWSIETLAAKAHLSGEHLRRLCLKELGRSPMQHVTYIRMCRAQSMLERSNDKLDVISSALGYHDTPAFIRAFKRWIGRNPTEYRAGE